MLFDSPRKYEVSIRASGRNLCFRHPWNGNDVCVGIAKLTDIEREEWRLQAIKLVERAPKVRLEAPAGTEQRILDAYFNQLKKPDIGKAPKLPVGPVEQAMLSTTLGLVTAQKNKLKRQNEAMQRQIDNLLRAGGERHELEKRTTLGQCLAHFKAHLQIRPGSKRPKGEKRDVLRRVTAVLEKVGLTRNYGDVILADVQKGLDESTDGEPERTKRGVDVKRFFKDMCKPKSQNGMGFIENPSVGLRFLSPRKLQQRREAMGMKVAPSNPEGVLEKLPPYWRALYACWLYCGLRRMESAALHWDQIEFDSKMVSVVRSAIYPQLKNFLSVRPVRPFREFWRHIEPYRKAKLNDVIVFPRDKCPTEYWIRIDKEGEPKINHLTREMSRELRRAGWTWEQAEKPNERARRHWASLVSARCPGLVEHMAAHNKAMHDDHYAIARRVIEETQGDWF